MLNAPSQDRCGRGAPPQRTTSSNSSDWAALAPCRRSPKLHQPTTRVAPPYSRVPGISRTWHATTSCTRYLPQLDLRQSLPLAAECDSHRAGGSEAGNHRHHWCQAAGCDSHRAGGSEAGNHRHHWCQAAGCDSHRAGGSEAGNHRHHWRQALDRHQRLLEKKLLK